MEGLSENNGDYLVAMPAAVVSIPVPKGSFYITGTGHDIVRLVAACKDRMRLMERYGQDPWDKVTVEVPSEDLT